MQHSVMHTHRRPQLDKVYVENKRLQRACPWTGLLTQTSPTHGSEPIVEEGAERFKSQGWHMKQNPPGLWELTAIVTASTKSMQINQTKIHQRTGEMSSRPQSQLRNYWQLTTVGLKRETLYRLTQWINLHQGTTEYTNLTG